MSQFVALLHPGGVPHSDALGLPTWLQWLIVLIAAALGGWLIVDARGMRKRSTQPEDDPFELFTEVPESVPARERLVASTVLTARPAATKPAPKRHSAQPATTETGTQTAIVELASGENQTIPPSLRRRLVVITSGTVRFDDVDLNIGGTREIAPDVAPTISALGDTPATAVLIEISNSRPAKVNPIGVLVIVLAIVAGWFALDRARAIEGLAIFFKTDGTVRVARLGFGFAALIFAGAAMVLVLPRVAAAIFALGALIGVFLAAAPRWESRLEWWGAAAVLADWHHLWLWAVGALGLALLSVAADYYSSLRNPHANRR
jgi:hypothetical protein